MYTPSIERLIEELSKLPGIGEKTAERLAFHLVIHRQDAGLLSQAVQEMVQKTKYCQICYNFAESTPCALCKDPKRNRKLLCVVEEPKDVISIERSDSFRGLYHVLQGRFAPLEGKDPEDLTIPGLVKRLDEGEIEEVILATNPTLEGDGTAMYLGNILQKYKVKVTRIARGISWGLTLSYANKASVADALAGRREMH